MIIRNESGARWLPARIGDFGKWQTSLLEESARRLGAVLDPGSRVRRYGSIGSPVAFRGQRAWLRVSPFLEHEMNRKAWRGTVEAAAIPGVRKPSLLHRIEWHADRLPAFQAASPAHIDLFAAASVRLWDEIAQSSASAWTKGMAQAAHTWFAYRQAC
jgi:hypothetical protein